MGVFSLKKDLNVKIILLTLVNCFILAFFFNHALAEDATLVANDPVEVAEFAQTDFSGGGGQNLFTIDGTSTNKFLDSDLPGNLSISSGELKLNTSSAVLDTSAPTYNLVDQARVDGILYGIYEYNLFDGKTTSYPNIQGAPINSVVGRYPTDLNTGASLTSSEYMYVEPGEQQETTAPHGLYYSFKLTLKKSVTMSQIRFFLYNDDGRKYTGYMIRGSNDDETYTDIAKVYNFNGNGRVTVSVPNLDYKYLKFYFDGYKSSDYEEDTVFNMSAGNKENDIRIKEIEIYDNNGNNVARAWGDVMNNMGPSYQERLLDRDAGNQYYQRVNTSGDIATLNTIDLGEVRSISGVKFKLRNGDIRRFYGYQVLVSNDNTNWTTKVDYTGDNADAEGYFGYQNIDFGGIESRRYIKLNGRKGAFSPDTDRFDWAGDTRFLVTSVEPQIPYYYGAVESSILDFKEKSEFLRIQAYGDYDTFGKEVRLYVRSGDTSSYNDDYWSSWVEVMGNIPNYLQNKRYFQYKVLLLSRDQSETPVINKITITHKAYRQDYTNYTASYSNDNYVPMESDITKPVESYRYNLGGLQKKEDTLVRDVDNDGVVDLIMVQGGRVLAKRWYSEDENLSTPYVDDIIRDTPNRGFSKIIGVHDFDNDGIDELLVINEGSVGNISIVNISTGDIIWTTVVKGLIADSVTRGANKGIFVDDLEGDGYLEIFAAGHSVQNSETRARMYSFINGYTQYPRGLIADGGNLMWESTGPFMGNRHQNHIALGKFVPGTTTKQIIRTDAYNIYLYNAETGEQLGIFKLPVPGYEEGSSKSYLLYPDRLESRGNVLFDDDYTTSYIHILDGNKEDIGKGNTYSESFQKNFAIIDLGTQRTFDQLKVYMENSSTRREHNILWEGSNDWDNETGDGTWTTISNWQMDTYGNYDDNRYCQGTCDTGILSSAVTYRYLRLRGTGSKRYTWRGLRFSEIDILNGGVSMKNTIKNETQTYVYPSLYTHHYTMMKYYDIDGDNVDEVVFDSARSGGVYKSGRYSWRGVLKFGNIGELDQTDWVWTDISNGYEASRINGTRSYISIDDIDMDGEDEMIVHKQWFNGTGWWSAYVYDLKTGKRKILKVNYVDQDRKSIAPLDGTDSTSYYYRVRCPDDALENYSTEDENLKVCELATIEFDSPKTIDQIDLKFYRAHYNYRIEATKDLETWTTVTDSSTEGNTTANFDNWQTNSFSSDSYIAFRFYISKSSSDYRGTLARIRFFDNGTDITSNVNENAYVWKMDGGLPGSWHSNSRMYGPLQQVGSDYYMPMYLGQRHGFYQLNTDKSDGDNIYFDLMYNTNSKGFGNTQMPNISSNFSNETDRNNYNSNNPRIPIEPIQEGSQGDVVISDGYNVRLIEFLTGVEKGYFPYNNVGTNDMLYYGDLGDDLGTGFIQSFGDGTTRIVSLSSAEELAIISTGNYYSDNIVVADIDNSGYNSIMTKNGANTVLHLDISNATPVNPPEVDWSWTTSLNVYSALDIDEQVEGSDQGKDFLLQRNYMLGKDTEGNFTWTRHIRTLANARQYMQGIPFGDTLSKWYYVITSTHFRSHDRSDFWRDLKNAETDEYWNILRGVLVKRDYSSGSENIVFAKAYDGLYRHHNSQKMSYDINNDGYDDFVSNHAYTYPIFLSGRDGLFLNMIRDRTYDWQPTYIQADDDPELELTGQIRGMVNVVHPKNLYIDQSQEYKSRGSTIINAGKTGIIDIDGDGIWEIFAQDDNGKISIYGEHMDLIKTFYVFDGELSTESIEGAGAANSITSIDINNDGNLNLIISGNDGYIYAINPNIDFTDSANLYGTGNSKAILWAYKVGANVSRLAFADIRNRGKTDIIFAAGDGYLRVLTQASIEKPTKVNDGATSGVNAEFTQEITSIGANWTEVDGAKGYIVKFVSESGQEIVPETAVTAGDDGTIPTQINITDVGLQVGKVYYAMVKAFDSGGVSEYTKSDGIEVVGFSITKQVRDASDSTSQFQDEITVGPGEMVQYKITVTNRTNRVAGGGKYNVANESNPVEVDSCDDVDYCEDRAIVIEDYMPTGFTYIAGTTAVNGESRANEALASNFVDDDTNTTTSLPTTAGAVLRWKLPDTDLIDPYGGTLELTFTARAN